MRPEPKVDDLDAAGEHFKYPNYEAYQRDLRNWFREESLTDLKKAVWDAELRITGVILMAATSHWIWGSCIFLSPFGFRVLETMIFQIKHINKPYDEVLKQQSVPQK